MIKDEFKKNVEQKLKSTGNANYEIEFCEISLEEENNLIQFLLNTHDLKLGWDVGQEITCKGYSNGSPFIIYPISNDIGSGVLVTTNRIVKFYSDYQGYDEYLYDGLIATQYSNSNITGRLNEKSVTVTYEDDDFYLSYCETQYHNLSTVPQRILNINDDVNRVYKDLVIKKLVAPVFKEKSAKYESFNIDKAFLVNDGGVSELARISTMYASSVAYLNGELPSLISLKTKNKKTARNFILLADNKFVDVDLYLEEGLRASIKTLDEICELISKNDLSLNICEKLEDWMAKDGIPSTDIEQIVAGAKKIRNMTAVRTLKDNN